MPARPKITIKLVDKKGPCACHHGHKIGDSFDFDTDRGKICPLKAAPSWGDGRRKGLVDVRNPLLAVPFDGMPSHLI